MSLLNQAVLLLTQNAADLYRSVAHKIRLTQRLIHGSRFRQFARTLSIYLLAPPIIRDLLGARR
jgi:hypothetical protein